MNQSRLTYSALHPQYTFESFIVSNFNREAFNAACMAANMENSKTSGVPLLISGSKGVGKSHLLQAIGNRVKYMHPNSKIQFWYCGNWVDDICRAIRDKRESEFYSACRDLDVLLIDGEDFDCIIRIMPKCRKKFFFTLTNVILAGKRVVMADNSIDHDNKYLIKYFSKHGKAVTLPPLDYNTKVFLLKEKFYNMPSSYVNKIHNKVSIEKIIKNIAEQTNKNIYELTEMLYLILRDYY